MGLAGDDEEGLAKRTSDYEGGEKRDLLGALGRGGFPFDRLDTDQACLNEGGWDEHGRLDEKPPPPPGRLAGLLGANTHAEALSSACAVVGLRQRTSMTRQLL